MNFSAPQFLWMLLLVLPLLGLFFFWSWRVKQKLIAQFVQSRLLGTLTVGVSPARQKLRLGLLVVGIAAIFIALSGPQFGFVWQESVQRGLDIVVVLDTSRSMLAKDVVPNRLEKAKLAVFDLMRQAKDDRLGLVPFAGNAFLQCPLTLDDQALHQSLTAINVGIIPQGGTALSQAIRTAQSAFEKNNNNHKVIVLFTDGEDHDVDTETLAAAKAAADDGVNIFTIGVGTPAGELLQVTDDKGNTSFIKDDDGNVVKSHLNEPLLQQIATATGGFYLPLVGADPMAVLYQRGLEPLPKTESTSKLTRVLNERYHWPLAFAVILLAVEFMLPDRSRERRTQKTSAPSTAASPPVIAALLIILLTPLAARASTPGAYDKYQSGDFQGAFDEYSRLANLKTNDYRLNYDAGTAAYRAKQLDAAEKQFNAALESPGIISDLNAQENSYYNLGNTHYQQGEPAATDPKKKQELWEKSIGDYAKALQLNTNDLEAKNNLAFVKKRLEELKQQQQQQQQQNNRNNQDQKDQKDSKQQQQQKQDQQKQDQKNQDQKDQQQQQAKNDQQQQQQDGKQGQPQPSQDQKSDQQKQQDAEQKQKQQAQAQKDQQQNQPTNNAQATAAGEDQRDKSADQNQQAANMVEAQMTQQEAKQMLDAQKDDEQTLIFSPENKPAHPIDGKFKDW